MEIIVKGRRTDVNDKFRDHVTAKIAKIGKLDQKVISVDVEVSQERNPRQADRRERVELTIMSRGPVIRAEAAAEDRYRALDAALDKLDARLRRMADRRKTRNGGRGGRGTPAEPMPDLDTALAANGSSVLGTAVVEPETEPRPETGADREPDETADGHLVPISMEGDGPVVVREKSHRADPMSIEQALFEMELVGHDFFLFRDKESGLPSVVYRRRGWDYGVIRLTEE